MNFEGLHIQKCNTEVIDVLFIRKYVFGLVVTRFVGGLAVVEDVVLLEGSSGYHFDNIPLNALIS